MSSEARSKSTPWGGESPAAGAARRRLVAAGRALLLEGGVGAVTMSGVARQARVTRPTVYRYVRDRAELLELVILDVSRTATEARSENLERFPTVHERIVQAALSTVDAYNLDGPLRRLWSSPEISADVIRVNTAEPTIAFMRPHFEPIFSLGNWTEQEFHEALETFQRLTLSLVLSPGPERSREELIGYLERTLLPAMGLSATGRATDRPTSDEDPIAGSGLLEEV